MRRRQVGAWVAGLGAESPEDGKWVLRLDLVDQLPARLDAALDAARELDRLLAGLGAGDDIRERPRDVVALPAQPGAEIVRLAKARALDAHLPGRVAAVEEVLLKPIGMRLWEMAVPSALLTHTAIWRGGGS